MRITQNEKRSAKRKCNRIKSSVTKTSGDCRTWVRIRTAVFYYSISILALAQSSSKVEYQVPFCFPLHPWSVKKDHQVPCHQYHIQAATAFIYKNMHNWCRICEMAETKRMNHNKLKLHLTSNILAFRAWRPL